MTVFKISLMTVVLGVLLIGSIMMLYRNLGPWVVIARAPIDKAINSSNGPVIEYDSIGLRPVTSVYFERGRFKVVTTGLNGDLVTHAFDHPTVVRVEASEKYLASFGTDVRIWRTDTFDEVARLPTATRWFCFTSRPDQFITYNLSGKDKYLWGRSRPDPWWGVAWLPEFWITIVLAAALIWSIVRDARYFRRLKRTAQIAGEGRV